MRGMGVTAAVTVMLPGWPTIRFRAEPSGVRAVIAGILVSAFTLSIV